MPPDGMTAVANSASWNCGQEGGAGAAAQEVLGRVLVRLLLVLVLVLGGKTGESREAKVAA